MAAERGAGQQLSQEMMEGEQLRGAAARGPGGRGAAARSGLAREKRGLPPLVVAQAPRAAPDSCRPARRGGGRQEGAVARGARASRRAAPMAGLKARW